MYTETERQESPKTVLLIGATGGLGGVISRALLNKMDTMDEETNLRLLVRPGSRDKLATDIAEKSEVVEDEASALADAFDGVYAVISAVQGGPETIVEAQLEWLRAARAAGVRRFIPSDYSFDLFGLAEGENVNSDWRREFARRAEEERGTVEVVHILNGCFLDTGTLYGFLGAFDLEKDEAYLWGEGDETMDFTTYPDTAAYIAEAALDERPLPEKFSIAGESLNFQELIDETEAGLGRKITVKKLGTLAEMDAEIDRRLEEQPDNMFAWLPLMYWRAMLNGKGKLGPLMNEEYPEVHPTGVREYAEGMAKEDS